MTMLVRRIGGLLVAMFAVLGAHSAEAQYYGSPSGRWFVDANVGASWGDFDNFTLAGTSLGTSSSDTGVTAGAGLGFYFTNQIYARLGYRYFGTFTSSGSFAGVHSSVDTSAHGLMLGLGTSFDLSSQLFVEATGEIGLAFLRSSGGQFAGFNTASDTETNFAGGIGLGLGYHLTSSTDLLVMGNYHWLGDAKASAGGLSLDANDLNVATATIGLRMKF